MDNTEQIDFNTSVNDENILNLQLRFRLVEAAKKAFPRPVSIADFVEDRYGEITPQLMNAYQTQASVLDGREFYNKGLFRGEYVFRRQENYIMYEAIPVKERVKRMVIQPAPFGF